MTYAATNPPKLIATGLAGRGNIWQYRSTDAAATVDGAGYITNASDLGMKAGDIVFVTDTDATPPALTLHAVASIAANGSADLTDAGSTAGTAGD